MIEELKKYSNKSSVVFLPKCDLSIYDSLEYTLNNVVKIDLEKEDSEIINTINNSKIKKIYLVGSNDIYRYILPRLKKGIEVCWIFKDSFSNLSNGGVRSVLNTIFEFYDRELVSSIGCLDKDAKEVLENAGYKCEYIDLQVKKAKGKLIKSNSIGILSNEMDANNNFYNQLAALTFVDYDMCKFISIMKVTKDFIKFFNINAKIENNIDSVMVGNFVNLYINFTNTNNELIIKSFNNGVPCLVGNTDFFNKNKYLKEHLVVRSDDDVNEISDKINFVKENGKKILEEYNKL